MLFNWNYTNDEEMAVNKDSMVLCCLFLNHNLFSQVGLGTCYWSGILCKTGNNWQLIHCSLFMLQSHVLPAVGVWQGQPLKAEVYISQGVVILTWKGISFSNLLVPDSNRDIFLFLFLFQKTLDYRDLCLSLTYSLYCHMRKRDFDNFTFDFNVYFVLRWRERQRQRDTKNPKQALCCQCKFQHGAPIYEQWDHVLT